jgi:uncharacterized protein YndB with AHSA1/START domain
MVDVAHEISAIQRSVGERVLPAGEARVITVRRTYRAGIDEVWDACTNPERIRRWFLPVSGELRVGGRYQLDGNAGGTVQRCDPPNGFAATWEMGGQVSGIEVRLSIEDDMTLFELEHVAHVSEELWLEYGPGAVGVGWDLAVLGLGLHVETGADPAGTDAGVAWLGTEEGHRFVVRSSDGWCEAGVAAGTPAELARAAADRTTAFYTPPARSDTPQ